MFIHFRLFRQQVFFLFWGYVSQNKEKLKKKGTYIPAYTCILNDRMHFYCILTCISSAWRDTHVLVQADVAVLNKYVIPWFIQSNMSRNTWVHKNKLLTVIHFLNKLNKTQALKILYAMTVYFIKGHRTPSRLRILLRNLYHDLEK